MSEQLYQIQEPAHKKVNKTTAIGIDLGTTNSVVAYIADSKIKLVVDEDNSPLQPSVVNKIGSDGKVLEIKSIKRLMGKNYADSKASKIHSNLEIIEEDNRAKLKTLTGNYTAEEISAVILANLKSLFKNNKDEDLTQAVITVPAFFSDIERQSTIKAAKIAGIEALRLINEPTAALLAYGLENNTKGNYVVYDLGGGTFDVSVLKLIEGIFQVKSTLGDVELGGDDFDLEISKHFNMQDNYEFFNIAKSLKHQLSTDNIAKETFEGIEYKLSENDFIQITKPLIDKTINIINKAIGDSQVEEINGIVLVGGSTKMPIIKKALSKSFNIEIFDDLNPETIVAKGAAIQADKLLNKNNDILLLDVNPISLGIETMGGIFERIIERNTPIPTSKGQNFSTFKDGQTSLAVNVYQGEREMVADNKLLGKLILKGIPTMPAGMPKIQISFMLDENSILKVKAVEKTTGVEQEITIESEISTEDSLKMLKDSIFNAKDDVNKREFTNSKVELEQVIQASKNLLNTNKLPQLEYNKLLSYVNEVESKLDTLTIKEDLDSTRLSLEDKFKEIVQDNMNELLAEKLIGEDLDSI